MNYNLKRHELLLILSEQKVKHELVTSDDLENIERHITYAEMLSTLKVSAYDFQILIKELYANKEIEYYYWGVPDKKGLYATSEGLTSCYNKKYRKANKAIIINNIKDAVQIIIPVVSLIITLSVVHDNLSKESKYTKQILKLEKRIEKLERELTKTPQTIYKK